MHSLRHLTPMLLLSFAAATSATPSFAVDVPPATASKSATLGDLTEYLTIAKDAQKIVKDGDLAKARARIRDLEKAWDQNEDKHRPLGPEAWDRTDQLMDKAIGKLRASKPDAQAVDGALNELVATLESLNTSK